MDKQDCKLTDDEVYVRRRMSALQMAIDACLHMGVTQSDSVLDTAKKFDEFLNRKAREGPGVLIVDLKGKELVLKNSRGPKIEIEIPDTEEAANENVVLGLKGGLSKDMTEMMKCDHLLKVDGFKSCDLDHVFPNMQLKLRSDDDELDTFYPEKLYAFRAYRNGAGLGLGFKVKMFGHFDELLDYFRQHKGKSFDITISPRQAEMFTEEQAAEAAASAEQDLPWDDGDIVDAEFPEVGEDRSHETRPRGGRRKKEAVAVQ